MGDYFVMPATVRLPLGVGDEWIEAKAEITYGEDKLIQGYGIQWQVRGNGETAGPDYERYLLKRAATWLVDWSLTDREGRRVPVSEAAIQALTPKLGAALDRVLDEHVAGVVKNALSGEQPRTERTTETTSQA